MDSPPQVLQWYCNIFFLKFGHAARLVGSQFPDQGLNPGPRQWKCRVLTTGPPGNSPQILQMLTLGRQSRLSWSSSSLLLPKVVKFYHVVDTHFWWDEKGLQRTELLFPAILWSSNWKSIPLAFLSSLLPAAWNADITAGVPAAILDHKMTLRMEAIS